MRHQIERPFLTLLIWIAICAFIGLGGGTLAVLFGDAVLEDGAQP